MHEFTLYFFFAYYAADQTDLMVNIPLCVRVYDDNPVDKFDFRRACTKFVMHGM